MKANTREMNSLIDSLFDGICQVDSRGCITIWNKGAERITGLPAGKILGAQAGGESVRFIREDSGEMAENETPLRASLQDGSRREVIAFLRHAEGYRVATLARILPDLDARRRVRGALMVFTDNKSVIAAHQQNQRVQLTTLFDGLTGIGNRSHIETRIRYAIEDHRTTNLPFGVLFIDIDHFKEFNDSYGHPTGDKVLRFVANSLRGNLRVSDSCGRWGGEEFVALVMDVHLAELGKVAEKLRALIEDGGVEEDGNLLKTTISIGAAMFQADETLDSLIKRADALMYRSKEGGRNRVTLET